MGLGGPLTMVLAAPHIGGLVAPVMPAQEERATTVLEVRPTAVPVGRCMMAREALGFGAPAARPLMDPAGNATRGQVGPVTPGLVVTGNAALRSVADVRTGGLNPN